MHVDYEFLKVRFFLWLDAIAVLRLEKVSLTSYTEERNVCMAYTFCGV